MKKTALICGVGGQDGAYLSQLLIKKNYSVYGTSRDCQRNYFDSLKKLNIKSKINLISMDPKNFDSVVTVIKSIKPTEIYYFSAQSSVSLSFQKPVDTLESITLGILNILEVCRQVKSIKTTVIITTDKCYKNYEKRYSR